MRRCWHTSITYISLPHKAERGGGQPKTSAETAKTARAVMPRYALLPCPYSAHPRAANPRTFTAEPHGKLPRRGTRQARGSLRRGARAGPGGSRLPAAGAHSGAAAGQTSALPSGRPRLGRTRPPRQSGAGGCRLAAPEAAVPGLRRPALPTGPHSLRVPATSGWPRPGATALDRRARPGEPK